MIPNASGDRIDGIVPRDGAETALKIRVSAPPDRGKANAAVEKLLAKCWEVPRASLSIVAGEKARNKTLLVAGEPQDIKDQLTPWFHQLGK